MSVGGLARFRRAFDRYALNEGVEVACTVIRITSPSMRVWFTRSNVVRIVPVDKATSPLDGARCVGRNTRRPDTIILIKRCE